jgi:hypothetical protein
LHDEELRRAFCRSGNISDLRRDNGCEARQGRKAVPPRGRTHAAWPLSPTAQLVGSLNNHVTRGEAHELPIAARNDVMRKGVFKFRENMTIGALLPDRSVATTPPA